MVNLVFRINLVLLGFFLPNIVSQDNTYKLCVTLKYVNECEQLQRGKSEVQCVKVQDSIECATRLKNGTADFGVFSAESTLHIATLNWPEIIVIKQLKHQDRINSQSDFESVVVVKVNDNKNQDVTLNNLNGKKFCHPGLHYGINRRWSERFLKHFERNITTPLCTKNKSPAEVEAMTLSKFFGPSCRPGKWSHDIKEDSELKNKYKSLCQLCNGINCEYSDDNNLSGPNSDHQKALECLKNRGDVTYVSLEDAQHFFKNEGKNIKNYYYLCPNNTLQAINESNTCTWLKQPWKVIMATRAKSVALKTAIDKWMSQSKNGGWESVLAKIINADSHIITQVTMEKPIEYINNYRDIPLPEPLCDFQVSWCTISPEEKDKCNVIRQGGITTGTYPLIVCQDPVGSTVNCLDNVNKQISDIVGIDSNFGYLARRMYDLIAAMYYETENDQYSSVVVVVHDNSKYKTFKDLKGAQACLPEFGATPSISFINLGKEYKFFNKKECRYYKLLHDFFGESCAPGALDAKHFRSAVNNERLCNLCLSENIREGNIGANISTETEEGAITCSADETNRYYGNKGALKCLYEVGDVAILELQSLKDHAQSLMLNERQFRIICRNGSLANRPGFDVDLDCALTTIVDGEIVVKRGSKHMAGIINLLSALDLYFQSDPDFKMYNIFNGKYNLLFKDSTIGLTSPHDESLGSKVENYMKLFKNIEDCQQGGSSQLLILNYLIFISFAFVIRIF